MADTRLFELVDGRELAWIEYGADGGAPVVALHGAPGSRYHFASLADVAARQGVRLIAPDRPGYGHSTYDPALSYASGAGDVAQLADHLGVDRFAVLGVSGGGANAAACARFLDDRVVGCAIVSGRAPPEANLGDHGMVVANRMVKRLVPVVPRLMELAFAARLRHRQRAPDAALAWMRRTLPACDVAVLDRPEIRTAVRDDLARPLSATAARAAVQDVRLALSPWGFRLGDIARPVHVWHGDLDRMTVIESGIYQADEIPHATLHRLPHEGHWLMYNHFDEILDHLTE